MLAVDSLAAVIANGSTAGKVAITAVLDWTSMLCEVTAGDWTQQLGTILLVGAGVDGQQLWL
jgi:hypothetical protein